jgi:hypothetical protein
MARGPAEYFDRSAWIGLKKPTKRSVGGNTRMGLGV